MDVVLHVVALIDAIDFLPFPHLETSIKENVQWLQDHPLVLKETAVSGWVYDVSSGRVRSRAAAPRRCSSCVIATGIAGRVVRRGCARCARRGSAAWCEP